jgi:hypothetical protein
MSEKSLGGLAKVLVTLGARGLSPLSSSLDATSLDATSLDATSLDATSLDATSLDAIHKVAVWAFQTSSEFSDPIELEQRPYGCQGDLSGEF